MIFTITLLCNSAASKRDEGKVFCRCRCTGAPCLSAPQRRESVRTGEGRSKGVHPVQCGVQKAPQHNPPSPSRMYWCMYISLYFYIFLMYVYVLLCR